MSTPADETRSKPEPADAPPAYKNPALPVEKRVEDLLSRMTLEEKVAQMLCVWQGKPATLVDPEGRFDAAQLDADLRAILREEVFPEQVEIEFEHVMQVVFPVARGDA